MSVEEFVTWIVKRFLAVIIMTVGIEDILQVYFPKIKEWHKSKMTMRLICFGVFSFVCSMVYDIKTWEQHKYILETFAVTMGCVVFFFPMRSMSLSLLEGIFNKIVGKKSDNKEE